MNKKLKIIITLIVILIVIGIVLFVNLNRTEQDKNIINENISQEQIIENSMKENLSNMGKLDRIKVYCGQFLTMIDKGNYQEAYNHLNNSFKSNYFPTLQDFMDYVVEKYPSNTITEFTNNERQGDLFVMTIKISSLSDDEFEAFEQNFVVKENGNNDYTISFAK